MSPRALLARAARRPRAAAVVFLGAIGLVAAAAAEGSELGAAALRAAGVLALLGAVALVVRRRARAPDGPAPVQVIARAPLARDSGVAVVDAAGRRFLVGYGAGGAALLAELREEERP